MSKFPAYERVSLRHPGFPRPVVIFGPVSDLARDRLSRDFPAKFAMPRKSINESANKMKWLLKVIFAEGDATDPESMGNKSTTTTNKSGIVRLSSIRHTMEHGKHALLDVTPNAVDKLNYAQLYPIVIFTRTESKQIIKECRSGMPK
jgi:tight junction protein 1